MDHDLSAAQHIPFPAYQRSTTGPIILPLLMQIPLLVACHPKPVALRKSLRGSGVNETSLRQIGEISAFGTFVRLKEFLPMSRKLPGRYGKEEVRRSA